MESSRELFSSVCFVLPPELRTLHNASACLSLIPEEYDTPKLRQIREFFKKNNIKPENPLGFYSLGVDKYSHISYFKNKPKEVVDGLIDEVYFSMSSAIFNVAEYCNQKVDMERHNITDYSYVMKPSGISDKGAEICNSNYGLLKEAYDISEGLLSERNKISDTEKIPDLIVDKWKERYAWDLSNDEISRKDILDWMGVE